jgi:ribosomal protein S19E (S16A)
MPSVSVKDVDQQKFTTALAAFLKKYVSVEEIC